MKFHVNPSSVLQLEFYNASNNRFHSIYIDPIIFVVICDENNHVHAKEVSSIKEARKFCSEFKLN